MSLDELVAADAVFIAALILVTGVCAFVGIATPLGSYATDTFFLLDNAYRVVQGQIPHLDFSSAWGPLLFVMDAIGLRLAGMRPSGIGYASAGFGAAISTWTFLLARAKWSPVVGCIAGVYTLLLIAAPFPLGNNPSDFSYAMVYNRYGYALLGIVLLESSADMLASKGLIRRGAGFAVSTGVALALLALLKVSYAFVAVAMIALLPIAGSAGGVRRIGAVAGGFAVVALLGLWYLRFDVSDMLHDLAMAANSRVYALEAPALRDVLSAGNVALVLLAALLRQYRGLFIALLTVALGTVVLVTNQQLGEFPLNAYAALVLVGTYVPQSEGLGKWKAGVAFLTAVCVLPLCEESVISLTSAALQKQWQWPPRAGVVTLEMPARGTSLRFAPFRGKKKTETDGKEYVEDLDDGLNLLRAHLTERKGVLAFDQFNAFNYILDLPSPRGGFAAGAYDYIFDDAIHPSAERFFGNASYVLVPKYREPAADRRAGEDMNTVALMRLYGPTLRAEFAVIAETKHWVLLRRKTNE